MKKQFKIEPYADYAKTIVVIGENLFINVDFDDVNHKKVEKDLKKMVEILNTYWEKD